jgi:hypothetical protein
MDPTPALFQDQSRAIWRWKVEFKQEDFPGSDPSWFYNLLSFYIFLAALAFWRLN